ncbi:hypothetical protein L6164_015001 [Bauhinia variegata]|uniref:Uncharacterized protein n=1 Tax=Bauhinia variegata TaxID=167791 RepID=A0ACB9NJC9_BAUVA|nr:hypothetical protein L6164_015001 [Bauhinia variegata]
MAERRERRENEPNLNLNGDDGDSAVQADGQDNHNAFAQVVQIRSSSSFLSINPNNSRALQMLTSDDVLAMQFDSYEAGESFYHKYASAVGFIVRKDDIGRNKQGEVVMRKWVCNREGYRQRKYLENANRRREPRPSTRVNCPATFRISLDRGTHKWVVKEFVAEHTHELAPTIKSHALQINGPIMEVGNVKKKGVINVEAQPSQMMNYLVKQIGDCDPVGAEKQDLNNPTDSLLRPEITINDVEAALAYLSAKKDADPGLFYETKIIEGHLASFFLSDSISQLDYACFGDVMAVCRMSAYRMHFVILAGLNHHHQTSVFGCALLDDETVEAYTWLFQTFLHVMHDTMPISIVTDGHKAVRQAVQQVLPQSRHRLCTWHLERNAHSSVDDTSFVSDLKVCMEIVSQDEFELKWKAMVDKYKLSGNLWIQKMHKRRHMWAQAYLRGHFWAGMQSTKVCEVDIIRCNEVKAEYDAIHVQFALSTPLVKIEKHAADVFTRESYKRFLSEMRLEALLFVLNKVDGTNFRIYTLGNYEDCNLTYEVVFEPCGPSLKCSCLKFETTGFPCSHAIHIIKSERLEQIPPNLIHPRWTKSAKSTAQLALAPVAGDVIMRMECSATSHGNDCGAANRPTAEKDTIHKSKTARFKGNGPCYQSSRISNLLTSRALVGLMWSCNTINNGAWMLDQLLHGGFSLLMVWHENNYITSSVSLKVNGNECQKLDLSSFLRDASYSESCGCELNLNSSDS